MPRYAAAAPRAMLLARCCYGMPCLRDMPCSLMADDDVAAILRYERALAQRLQALIKLLPAEASVARRRVFRRRRLSARARAWQSCRASAEGAAYGALSRASAARCCGALCQRCL